MIDMKMKKMKYTALSLLIGSFVLHGCGGGSGNDRYEGVNEVNALELAQIAAAIQVAKTGFDVVVYDGESVISQTIKSGQVDKKIACRSGSFQVNPNVKTTYKEDGLLQYDNCLTTNSKWNGAIELECLDVDCEESITTATSALWGDRDRNLNFIANGQVFSDALRDGFKGRLILDNNNRKTEFDFADVGLIQDYYNNGLTAGFGQLKITGGKANRCIDGHYGYDVSSRLITENNSLRVIGGKLQITDSKNRNLGEVQFETDGAVSVYTRDGRKDYFPASEFESYCGLSDAYRFSTY